MAQRAKCLPHKHEDLSSDPQSPCRCHMGMDLSTLEVESSRISWPARLTESTCSRFTKRS